jgi:hypothetical protein
MLSRYSIAASGIVVTIILVAFVPSRAPIHDVYPSLVGLKDRVKGHLQQSVDFSDRSDISDVLNSTLGFHKVFVVSLPERSDKRDAISLQGRLTNISVEMRDGVLADTIPARAPPLVSSDVTGRAHRRPAWG